MLKGNVFESICFYFKAAKAVVLALEMTMLILCTPCFGIMQPKQTFSTFKVKN